MTTALFSTHIFASSVHISTHNAEHEVEFKQSTFTFKPKGAAVNLSLDISESLYAFSSVEFWQHSQKLTNRLQGELNTHAYGLGVGYNTVNGYLIMQAAQWHDDIELYNNKQFLALQQDANSKSYAIELGRDTQFYDLNVSYSVTLTHYEWQQTRAQFQTDNERLNVKRSNDSQYASLAVDTFYDYPINAEHELMFGVQLNWFQTLKQSDAAIDRTKLGGAKSSRQSRGGKQSGTLQRLKNENYGNVQLYAMLFFDIGLSLDMSISQDFASDTDDHTLSIGFGYQF